jgi:hypothetical protein
MEICHFQNCHPSLSLHGFEERCPFIPILVSMETSFNCSLRHYTRYLVTLLACSNPGLPSDGEFITRSSGPFLVVVRWRKVHICDYYWNFIINPPCDNTLEPSSAWRYLAHEVSNDHRTWSSLLRSLSGKTFHFVKITLKVRNILVEYQGSVMLRFSVPVTILFRTEFV